MENNLYYCKYWKPINYNSYEIVISDIIYSQEKKYFQIHGIVSKEGNVLRVPKKVIDTLETKIKLFVLPKIEWSITSINKNILKFWYYNKDDSAIDINQIPLRFTITALDISAYNFSSDFKEKLFFILKDVLNIE